MDSLLFFTSMLWIMGTIALNPFHCLAGIVNSMAIISAEQMTGKKSWANIIGLMSATIHPTFSTISWVTFSFLSNLPMTEKSIMPRKGCTTKILIRKPDTRAATIINFKMHPAIAKFLFNWIDINIKLEFLSSVNVSERSRDEIERCKQSNLQPPIIFDFPKVVMSILLTIAVATISGIVPATAVLSMFFIPSNESLTTLMMKDKIKKSDRIPLKDGVYRLYFSTWTTDFHKGIGYIQDGCLYTRYHVTENHSIEVYGTTYKPCYTNKAADNQCYGSTPSYAHFTENEVLTVAMAGPHSNDVLKYDTMPVIKSNVVTLRGNRSMPGCSGSPILVTESFTIQDPYGGTRTSSRYRIVGTIGWFDNKDPNDENHDRFGAEVFCKEESISKPIPRGVAKGEIRQIFRHPGGGKTMRDMVSIIEQDGSKFDRIVVTGPSKVVCNELYHAVMKTNYIPSLITSDASFINRGNVRFHKVIIAAHNTILNMKMRGDPILLGETLYIMDESHFMDPSTISLKNWLRHEAKESSTKTTLVELTATGFDRIKKQHRVLSASNYKITEINLEPESMIRRIIQFSESEKALVFCSSIVGKEETSVNSLARTLIKHGKKFQRLTRDNFKGSYNNIKEMDHGIILATDIAECGANIPGLHTVYDFAIGLKPVMIGSKVKLKLIPTDVNQYIQRRGRVGRLQEGLYISPNQNPQPPASNRVENWEAATIAQAFGFETEEPVPGPKPPILTSAQVAVWKGNNKLKINNPRTVKLILNNEGSLNSYEEAKEKFQEFYDDGDPNWWDERDNSLLLEFTAVFKERNPIRAYKNFIAKAEGKLVFRMLETESEG